MHENTAFAFPAILHYGTNIFVHRFPYLRLGPVVELHEEAHIYFSSLKVGLEAHLVQRHGNDLTSGILGN